jgi:hypothetical protein
MLSRRRLDDMTEIGKWLMFISITEITCADIEHRTICLLLLAGREDRQDGSRRLMYRSLAISNVCA